MSFLRRLLGGGPSVEGEQGKAPGDAPPDPSSVADDEAARDRELLLDEARRLDDDLIQRQLRYADRSWTPPSQGGARRAGDEDAAAE